MRQDASETYLLVYGSFTDLKFKGKRKVDPADGLTPQGHEIWTARFVGNRASARAFDQPFETEVTLTLQDYSQFSGFDPAAIAEWLAGQTGLIWLEKTGNGYRAESGLCSFIVDTDPEKVKPALRCLTGRNCPKPD